ncbi:MAG: hypothetical protein WCS01_07915 [bacterium]
MSRDPIGDEAFRRQYSLGKTQRIKKRLHGQSLAPVYLFIENAPAMRVDSLGLLSFDSSCDAPDALLPADKAGINAEVDEAKSKLQAYEDGAVSLPGNLTAGMAACLKGKLDSVTVKCLSCANPVCWIAEGFAWPSSGCVGLCAYKFTGSQSASIIGMSIMIFHEMVHECGKWGHASPDSPDEWAGWLWAVTPL